VGGGGGGAASKWGGVCVCVWGGGGVESRTVARVGLLLLLESKHCRCAVTQSLHLDLSKHTTRSKPGFRSSAADTSWGCISLQHESVCGGGWPTPNIVVGGWAVVGDVVTHLLW
jgi:hypothetical protein